LVYDGVIDVANHAIIGNRPAVISKTYIRVY